MNQELTTLRQTWEEPEKELLFLEYKVTDPPGKELDILVGLTLIAFVALCFSSNFPEKVTQWIKVANIILFIACAIYSFSTGMSQDDYQTRPEDQASPDDQPFFKIQEFYDDEIFFYNAKGTRIPHYHEVIKVERPDLGQAPPEFRDLPEADKLVFVETRVLESSSPYHQDSTKWILHLEPGDPIPVHPGDHLVSLYGNKKQDHYAVHAQSCYLAPPKIVISPISVLLSLKGYVDTVKERINY